MTTMENSPELNWRANLYSSWGPAQVIAMRADSSFRALVQSGQYFFGQVFETTKAPQLRQALVRPVVDTSCFAGIVPS